MTVTPKWHTSDGNTYDNVDDANKAEKLICYKARLSAIIGSVPPHILSLMLRKGDELMPIMQEFADDPDMVI